MAKTDTTKLASDDPFADTGAEDIGSTDELGAGGVFDFGEIETPQLMPQHTCRARIVKAEPSKAKSGSAGIVLQWLLLDGDFEGRKLRHDMSLHPNAASITKGHLMKLGMPESFRGTLADLCRDVLLDTEADITVGKQDASVGKDGQQYDERNVVRGFRNVSKGSDGGF